MGKLIVILAIALCYANADQLDGSSPRIINGGEASENQFPYVVSLQQRQVGVAQPAATRGHRCGGVLINLQSVLTTATCVLDNVGSGFVTITPSAYRVFAGSSLLTNDGATDRVRDIANITVHPNYISAPALVNDIAFIRLTTPFIASTAIQPLPLPADSFEPADFTVCTVAGWGANTVAQNVTASVQLRYANKYTYNQDLCTLVYNSGGANSPNVLPSMMCAASFDIISTGCVGDFGNALVCNGTLSGLLISNQGCQPTAQPELYVRISHYTSWIRSVGAASTFAPGVFTIILLTIVQFFNTKVFA